jgi:hypothetical protein
MNFLSSPVQTSDLKCKLAEKDAALMGGFGDMHRLRDPDDDLGIPMVTMPTSQVWLGGALGGRDYAHVLPQTHRQTNGQATRQKKRTDGRMHTRAHAHTHPSSSSSSSIRYRSHR